MTTTPSQVQQFAYHMPLAKQFMTNCLCCFTSLKLSISTWAFPNVAIFCSCTEFLWKCVSFMWDSHQRIREGKRNMCLVCKSLVTERLGQQIVSQTEEHGIAGSLISGLFGAQLVSQPQEASNSCVVQLPSSGWGALNYSSLQQRFIEHLLCARHDARSWGCT